ncbi:glycosyltransferase, partial [Halobacillus sp. BAB-2008]|uniref:glycosyltransferase n=1 Tax=Halobacillus sp. BAB-2008 TaxID=1246484 RepID=UPI0002A50122
KTFIILLKNRPSTLWIQLPPSILLYQVFIYKLFFRDTKIISDCHNGQFRSPWLNFPFSIKLINFCSEIIIVHNDDLLNEVKDKKILNLEKVHVLEDNLPIPSESIKIEKPEENLVLFPASFNSDEPISELVEAAKKVPHINIYITGEKSAEKLNRHSIKESDLPSNIKFTGWLTDDSYKTMLKSADIILGLTLLDTIQLSVAIEAVGYEKAMVLSNTNTLKKLFNKGSVFVDNDGASIAKGIIKALESKQELEKETKQLKVKKTKEWFSEAEKLKKII